MEDKTWALFSPMCFQFRAYRIEENRKHIIAAFEAALDQFKYCEEIQIEITAPARGLVDVTGTNEKQSHHHSANTVVKGFAG